MYASTVCENLKSLLEQVEKAHWIRSHNVLDQCQKYANWKRDLIKEQGEEGVEKFDQLDSLITIVKSLRRTATSHEVVEKIDRLFGNRYELHDKKIRLLTIHQAKGQEEDCVY